jgi:hypothetical protein
MEPGAMNARASVKATNIWTEGMARLAVASELAFIYRLAKEIDLKNN